MIPKFIIGQKVCWVNIPCNINHGEYDYSIFQAEIVDVSITLKDSRFSEKGIIYNILYSTWSKNDNGECYVYKEHELAPEEHLFDTQLGAFEFVNKHFADWEKENDNESI